MDLKKSIAFQLEENCEKTTIFLALSVISWRLSGYNVASFWFLDMFRPSCLMKRVDREVCALSPTLTGNDSTGRFRPVTWDDFVGHCEALCKIQKSVSKWVKTGTYSTSGTLNKRFAEIFFLLWLDAQGTLKLESWSLEECVRSHNELAKCLC